MLFTFSCAFYLFMILFCQSPFSVSTHIFSPYYYLVHILLEVVGSGASLSLGDCLHQQMAGHSEVWNHTWEWCWSSFRLHLVSLVFAALWNFSLLFFYFINVLYFFPQRSIGSSTFLHHASVTVVSSIKYGLLLFFSSIAFHIVAVLYGAPFTE